MAKKLSEILTLLRDKSGTPVTPRCELCGENEIRILRLEKIWEELKTLYIKITPKKHQVPTMFGKYHKDEILGIH